MNQEKIDELTTKLATAMGLLDEVLKAAHAEMGYKFTRNTAHRASKWIAATLESLQEDWARDERELEEDLAFAETQGFRTRPEP